MRWIKWLLLGMLLLPALWFGLVLTHWLPRLTSEQSEALALVDQVQSRRLGEHNAYPLLWLFKYAVPRDQLDAVMAEDLQRFAQYAVDAQPEQPFGSIAAERYGELPEPTRAAAACFGRGGGSCLADVRANLEAVRVELGAQGERLQRESWLSDYDHIAIAFPRSFSAPITLYFGDGGVVRSAAAYAHLNGDSTAALEQLCMHTRSWRLLRQHTDLLVADVLGQSVISANARLVAEILAEDSQLDTLACLDSFAPLGDEELDQCSAMVGEYQAQAQLMDALEADSEAVTWIQRRMINSRHSLALMAQSKAYYCQAAHQQRIQQRTPEPAPPEHRCSLGGQLFNPVGCVLVAIAQPVYDIYYLRALDLDAQLKTLQAARWLRAHAADQTPAQGLARLPAELRSPSHQLSLSHDGTDLQLQLLQPRGAEPWSIPISRPVADPN